MLTEGRQHGLSVALYGVCEMCCLSRWRGIIMFSLLLGSWNVTSSVASTTYHWHWHHSSVGRTSTDVSCHSQWTSTALGGLSVCLSVSLSVRLSVSLSLCLSVHRASVRVCLTANADIDITQVSAGHEQMLAVTYNGHLLLWSRVSDLTISLWNELILHLTGNLQVRPHLIWDPNPMWPSG